MTGAALRPRAVHRTAEGEALPRIVAVDDDDVFRELLTTELELQGFEVRAFADAEALLEVDDATTAADAIVLDWQLPGLSGFELLTELRHRGIATPVIFLTGNPLVANEMRAFNAGAADFIDKTRGFDILVHRLRLVAVTPASIRAQRRLQVHGRLLLNPVEGRAAWDGADIRLTLSEYRVLEFLVATSPESATYREIYNRMRSPGFVRGSERTCRTNVRSAIRRIRAKFAAYDPGFAQIGNAEGLGYTWKDQAP